MTDTSLRFDYLERSFLWRDIGWLHLRLVPHGSGEGWHIVASANSGPWNGTFSAHRFAEQREGAVWLALLTPTSARILLVQHPSFAQALAEQETLDASHA